MRYLLDLGLNSVPTGNGLSCEPQATLSELVLGGQCRPQAPSGPMKTHISSAGRTSEGLGQLVVVKAIPGHQTKQFPICRSEPSESRGHDDTVNDVFFKAWRPVGFHLQAHESLDESVLTTTTAALAGERTTGDSEQPGPRRIRDLGQSSPGNEKRLCHGVFGRFRVDTSQRVPEHGVDMVVEDSLESFDGPAGRHLGHTMHVASRLSGLTDHLIEVTRRLG
jgi:hypothetical protein